MDENFDDRREEMSEIQRLLQELKDANIGFENYKKFFDKVKSSDAVLITQINNRTREYEEYKSKFMEVSTKDSFRQLKDDGFVTVEVFNFTRMMNRNMKEAFNWKTLQEEMYSIIFNKLFDVLDDARALDIKRDALKEMREMEEKRQEMFIRVMENMSDMFQNSVNTKLSNYDEKLFNLVMMNDEEHRKDRREIFNSLKELVSIKGLSKKDQNRVTSNFGSDGNTRNKTDILFSDKNKEKEKDNSKKDEKKESVDSVGYDTDKKHKDEEEDDNIDDIIKKRPLKKPEPPIPRIKLKDLED